MFSFEPYRDEALVASWHYFGQLGELQQFEIIDQLERVFAQWLESKTDPDGTVMAWDMSGSGLGLLQGWQRTQTRRPASEVKPWEVAGEYDRNRIDLGFHLLGQSFAPFNELLLKHGIAEVFSIAALLERETKDFHSLINVNALLVRSLAAEVQWHKAHQPKAKARVTKPEAALNRGKGKTTAAAIRKERLIQAALEFRQIRTKASRDETIDHVYALQLNWPKFRHTREVVERKLGGIWRPRKL